MTLDDSVHAHRIRVRYCETDRMGVAHHGAYVDWLEEARTEWMRAGGSSYRALEDRGVLLQVVHVDIAYRRSVTYDDEIVVHTRLAERKRVTLTIAYRIEDAGGRLVAEATTTLACVDRSGKLRRLPEEV